MEQLHCFVGHFDASGLYPVAHGRHRGRFKVAVYRTMHCISGLHCVQLLVTQLGVRELQYCHFGNCSRGGKPLPSQSASSHGGAREAAVAIRSGQVIALPSLSAPQNMTQQYLYLKSILYLLFAIWCTVAWQSTWTHLGYLTHSNGGTSEYSVIYAGLQLGLAVLLFLLARDPSYLD